jgi:hypothetical protein
MYDIGYIRIGTLEVKIEAMGLVGTAYLGNVYFENELDLMEIVADHYMRAEAERHIVEQAKAVIANWKNIV